MRLMCSSALAIVIGLGTAGVMAPAAAQAQISIGISVNLAPPPLPIYEQPPLPAPDYLWAPGYWAWDNDFGDYYWVPGAWVQAPTPGYLWTPAYWGWNDGVYMFHDGYWGPHVGFYGGVAYGFGYTGDGYEGGYWNNGHVFYNQSVNNFGGAHITNVYNKTVVNVTTTRVSYNGGSGGLTARPTAAQMTAASEHHIAPTPMQTRQQHIASTNKALFASSNHGAPPIAATARAGVFAGAGVVHAARAGGPAYTLTANHGPKGPGAAAGGHAAMAAGAVKPDVAQMHKPAPTPPSSDRADLARPGGFANHADVAASPKTDMALKTHEPKAPAATERSDLARPEGALETRKPPSDAHPHVTAERAPREPDVARPAIGERTDAFAARRDEAGGGAPHEMKAPPHPPVEHAQAKPPEHPEGGKKEDDKKPE